MSPTRMLKHVLASAALAGALGLGLAACGSSSSSVSGGSGITVAKGVQTPRTEAQSGGKRGGTLTVLNHTDFEHIDPGQAYFNIDYEVIYATQRPLFSYKPNTFAAPSPDMASGPAQISADGKTITIHIRSGVHFSPPVNREVTSADVAYAIERGANANVPNPYFSSYFGSLVGAGKEIKEATGGPFPGITTPDKGTIVFHLSQANAPIVLAALVLPLSAPVPEEFAKQYDAKKPTEYGNYQVATGPYMLKSNSAGKVLGIGYQPGKSATLVRNPNWNPVTDSRPAYLDQIDIQIGGDATVIGRQVLEGSGMVQNEAPAQSIVKLAYEKFRKQLEISPGAGDHYIAVNNKQGPFSNIDVRKALWAALDRTALDKARGGALVTNVMTHFIYPEIPGFEAGGRPDGPAGGLQRIPRRQHGARREVHEARGLPERQLHGLKDAAGRRLDGQPGRRRCRNRQPDAEEPRFQDEVQARRLLGDVREVLRGARRSDRCLPERRLGRRLRRPPGGARRAVQRQEHHVNR